MCSAVTLRRGAFWVYVDDCIVRIKYVNQYLSFIEKYDLIYIAS